MNCCSWWSSSRPCPSTAVLTSVPACSRSSRLPAGGSGRHPLPVHTSGPAGHRRSGRWSRPERTTATAGSACSRRTAGSRTRSAPGRTAGHVAIGHFYDTFIGPRDITHHPDVGHRRRHHRGARPRTRDPDGVDGDLLTLRVPTFIRYDLKTEDDELRIAALSAFWELPAMIGQFARSGLGAVPAGVALDRRCSPIRGCPAPSDSSADFAVSAPAARGSSRDSSTTRAAATRSACGDACRHVACHRGATTASLSAAELVKHLPAARWHKLIGSGHAVVARASNATDSAASSSARSAPVTLPDSADQRIRVFSEAGATAATGRETVAAPCDAE